MGTLRANAAYARGCTRGHHGESEDSSVYLTRLALENVRAFENLELSFASAGQPRMTNVVIGRNGTGKSTLLRCVVLGLAGQAQANALRTEDLAKFLVGPRGESAKITVELAELDGSNPTRCCKTLEKGPSGEVFVRAKGDADAFVCAYGAGRATAGGEDAGGGSIVETTYTLFNYNDSLNGVELTLRRLADYLGDSRYENVMHSVMRALSLSDGDEIRFKRGGGVEVTGPSVGATIPLESWADGYRLSLALILDIYAWAMRNSRVSEDGSVTGLLLIDEVEQHLHPALQASLAPELSNLFGGMQLIATTHSPLATMGVDRSKVIALRRDDDSVTVVDWLPDFADFSVDDVLAHQNLFATPPYGTDAAAKLARWRELASTEPNERTPQEDGELREIAKDFQQARVDEEKSPLERALEELQRQYQL